VAVVAGALGGLGLDVGGVGGFAMRLTIYGAAKEIKAPKPSNGKQLHEHH